MWRRPAVAVAIKMRWGEALWGCCAVVEGIVVGLGRLLQEASGQWLEWVVATAEWELLRLAGGDDTRPWGHGCKAEAMVHRRRNTSKRTMCMSSDRGGGQRRWVLGRSGKGGSKCRGDEDGG